MRNGALERPIQLQPPEEVALERLGSNIGGCIRAFDALRDSLVRLSSTSGDDIWQFSHPTVGDAYAATLAQHPEHIEIFVRGSDPEKLVREITCGDVGLKNAVVVPRSLFPQIIEKLKDIKGTFEAKDRRLGFLTYRCSEEFLSLYLDHNPDLLYEVSNPGLYLEAVPEVPLAERLHEFGLLPNEQRRAFVEKVSGYALEGEDASAVERRGDTDYLH